MDKIGNGHRFYSTVPFTEIIFEHSDVRFITEDPIDVVARKSPSLSGSKPIVVEDFGDFFETNAVVTQLENSSDHACGSIVNDRSANRAYPFLTFPFFNHLPAIPVGRPENEKALSNSFSESLSNFSSEVSTFLL
jgi:hypothetical protein